MIVIGELMRIANMEAYRLPRMMIGSHMKRLNGEKARRGDGGATRSTLRSTKKKLDFGQKDRAAT
jgi:hypothetical protein